MPTTTDPTPIWPPALPVYEFGTVLQHSRLHHVLWLVLCPAPGDPAYPNYRNYYAMSLAGEGRTERAAVIGHTSPEDWNVLEVICGE